MRRTELLAEMLLALKIRILSTPAAFSFAVSCIIVFKYTASAVFVAFWLVLPFRERKNFIRFS